LHDVIHIRTGETDFVTNLKPQFWSEFGQVLFGEVRSSHYVVRLTKYVQERHLTRPCKTGEEQVLLPLHAWTSQFNAPDADRDLFQPQLDLARLRLEEILKILQLYRVLAGVWHSWSGRASPIRLAQKIVLPGTTHAKQ